MKAAVIEDYRGIEGIAIKEVPMPASLSQEVLIKVHYAGLNPIDHKIVEGKVQGRMPEVFPITIGWDVAGEITHVGKEVKNLHVGDKVFAYCRKKILHDGACAEYIALDAENVVLVPKNLSLDAAATIPLSGLTAYQSLFDAAHLKEGQTVLIHAGAGGVGSIALQLAKLKGARIFTTASQENHPYVKALGADVAIDYKTEDLHLRLKTLAPDGVDVVFDTVGGKTFANSLDLLKKGGSIVSILERLDPKLAEDKGIIAKYVFVEPNGKELQILADHLQRKELLPPRYQTFAFHDVPLALKEMREGIVKGKCVIQIS